MGQIDFYTVGRDEAQLLAYAKRDHGLLVFRGISSEPAADPVESLPCPGEEDWQSFYLAPRGRAKEVKYRKVPTKPTYAIDMTGPVLRWMRSAVVRDELVRGWIYLNTDRRRPHELELAYHRLEAWIRKHFRRRLTDRAYAGPQAWEHLLKHPIG